MASGTFPLYRMTSVYACALSLGTSARLALALHGLVALSVVTAATLTAHRLGGDPSSRAPSDPRTAAWCDADGDRLREPLSFSTTTSQSSVVGLALALPRLARLIPPRGLVALLLGIGVIGVVGLVCNVLVTRGAMPSLSFGGPALLACFGVVLGALGGHSMGRHGSGSTTRIRMDNTDDPSTAASSRVVV